MSNEFFKTYYKIENLAVSILQIQFAQLGILLVARYRVHNALKPCLKEYSHFHYAFVFLQTISFKNIKRLVGT